MSMSLSWKRARVGVNGKPDALSLWQWQSVSLPPPPTELLWCLNFTATSPLLQHSVLVWSTRAELDECLPRLSCSSAIPCTFYKYIGAWSCYCASSHCSSFAKLANRLQCRRPCNSQSAALKWNLCGIFLLFWLENYHVRLGFTWSPQRKRRSFAFFCSFNKFFFISYFKFVCCSFNFFVTFSFLTIAF